MSVEFVDTNILLYAASGKPEDREKSVIARAIVFDRPVAISLQVLQEFYTAARKPRKLALGHDDAVRFCKQWRTFLILEPTLQLFDAALELCGRYQISYYDAAILAAARQLGCAKVYSEDLNDGQDYDGVRVENPFRGIPASAPQP